MTKIALIGYGYWGPNVAKNLYKNKEYEFCAICDKRAERLKIAEGIYASSLRYITSSDEIIANPQIDAVALAVETSAHYALAKQALLAGKDVYIEKPMTDNLWQAQELTELAEKNGRILHVDHIMVYHPAIRKIKEIIDSGELGDIIWMDCSRLNLGQLKNDVSSMWDLSVHDLAIIDYLTNGAAVENVKAMGSRMYSKRESITQMMVQYDGFFASIRASWLSPIKERRLIVAGTKKMIHYDDVDVLNKLIVYDKGFDTAPNTEYSDYVMRSRSGDAWIPHLPTEDALYNSLEQFRSCIVSRKPSLTDGHAAIRVIKILEMGDQSLAAQREE
jgi:predicted dehydrogenase